MSGYIPPFSLYAFVGCTELYLSAYSKMLVAVSNPLPAIVNISSDTDSQS
jgi:hypothetical protein